MECCSEQDVFVTMHFLKINLPVVVNCELSLRAMEGQNNNKKEAHGGNNLCRKLEFRRKILKVLGKNQNRLTFKYVLFKTFQLHENIEDFFFTFM